MDNLKIDRNGYTLVDQVEEKLIGYFKQQGLRPGSSIPNENELSAALGIGRTVLREALSRFKMTGMIRTRTKCGMTLAEPSLLASLRRTVNPLLMSPDTLRNLFQMRIALELGSSYIVFTSLTAEDIRDLESIVEEEERRGNYFHSPGKEKFHSRLYTATGNKMISEFLEVVLPAFDCVVEQHRSLFETRRDELHAKGKLVTHRDLMEYIKADDQPGYCNAMLHHFDIYNDYLRHTDAETLTVQTDE